MPFEAGGIFNRILELRFLLAVGDDIEPIAISPILCKRPRFKVTNCDLITLSDITFEVTNCDFKRDTSSQVS